MNLKKLIFETKAKDEIKDIENLFFGNIFNKIGAVVLIIAFGIFLKFVSQFIEFTPILKIVLALYLEPAWFLELFIYLKMIRCEIMLQPLWEQGLEFYF